jgi:hypothetical protein
VAAVMVHHGTDIPSIRAMGCPLGALVRLLMKDDLGSQWCHWCAVEIKGSMQVCLCRELGMEA